MPRTHRPSTPPPRIFCILMLVALLVTGIRAPQAQATPAQPETASQRASAGSARTPASPTLAAQTLPNQLAFVPAGGRGRNEDLRFEVRGAHGTLFLTPRETIFALPTAFPPRQPAKTPAAERAAPKSAMGLVRQRFLGAAAHPKVSGLERLPGVVNEYLGSSPADWRTQIPSYGAVQFYALYPGIDLRYDGRDGQLKRSFLLAAAADASAIQWRYQGVDTITVDPASGDLRLQITVRLSKAQQDQLDTDQRTMPITMTERAPRAWQETPQGRVVVPVQFVLGQGQRVGFALGAYDHAQPLVIDPTLTYIQPFGGSGVDSVQDMLLTTEGTTAVLAIIGTTWSTDYGQIQGTATLTGVSSLFVSKRNPDTGTMLWDTFFGGGNNGQNTNGNAIARGTSDKLLITGSTASPHFPHLPLTAQACGTVEQVYVSALNLSDGVLQASRCLGTAPAATVGHGIAVDSTGQVWIAGSSRAGDFLQSLGGTLRVYGLNGNTQPVPYWPTLLQGFLVKLDANFQSAKTRIYFGSASGAQVADLALDDQDRPVVVGDAYAISGDSVLFPTTANGYQAAYSYGGNFYDAFIMQLSADGSTQTYSSWLGDVNTYDRATSVIVGKDAIDRGDIYVTGDTLGSNQAGQRAFGLPPRMDGLAWETIRGTNQAAFVVRVRPSATSRDASLIYGSLLRATSSPQYTIDTNAIAAHNGVAYLVGTTQQADMLVNPALAYQRNGDAYLAALDTTQRAMPMSSYFGGTGADSGWAVQLQYDGSVLVGGNLNAYTVSQNASIARVERAPATTLSYYERTINPEVHRKQGCSARARGEQGAAILFYGSPRYTSNGRPGAGLKVYGKDELQSASVDDIQKAVVAFADGYVYYQSCAASGIAVTNPRPARLNLLITTSNSMFSNNKTGERRLNDALTYAHGQAWATMVLSIKQELFTKGIGGVTVAGGYDAEPDWWYVGPAGQWAPQPVPTFDWARGYDSVQWRLPYYFIGSTDGGPRDSSWLNNSSVPLLDQVFELAWGISAARPLPQIYNAGYAKEWYQLRRYSIIRKQRPMVIQGVLTECGSSNCTMTTGLPWMETLYDFVNQEVPQESPKRTDFSPRQGWYAMDDTLRRSLIVPVITQDQITPPLGSSLFQQPDQRLTIPSSSTCQPVYLSFGYQTLPEPQTTLLRSSCLPVGTVLPTDTTLPSGWSMPATTAHQVFFSAVAPQSLPLLTDICYAQRFPTDKVSGAGQCVR